MANIEKTTLSIVPQDERKSWQSIAFIQTGIIVCIPSLMFGGILADGMNFQTAMIAGILGYLLLTVISTIVGIQGFDLGVPTCVIASSSFGKSGSRIILSSLFIISLIGWFAVQTNVCAAAFSNLFLECFNINIPLEVSTMIWGIIMMITAVYGISALDKLSTYSMPALLLVCFYGVFLALRKYGLESIHTPVPGALSMIESIDICFGFGAIGAVVAADFTRYQKSRVDTVKSTFLGILPSGIIMTAMGYVMAKATGNYDISLVMADIGIPLMGMIVLVLGTWTTNTTNSYSAGIDIVMLFNLKDNQRAKATLISGFIGTLLALMGAINYLEEFLLLTGYALTPIAGVMIGEYWIVLKGDSKSWKPVDGFNKAGILSWGIGTIATITITIGSPIVNGIIISSLSFAVLDKVFNKNTNKVNIISN